MAARPASPASPESVGEGVEIAGGRAGGGSGGSPAAAAAALFHRMLAQPLHPCASCNGQFAEYAAMHLSRREVRPCYPRWSCTVHPSTGHALCTPPPVMRCAPLHRPCTVHPSTEPEPALHQSCTGFTRSPASVLVLHGALHRSCLCECVRVRSPPNPPFSFCLPPPHPPSRSI